MKMVNRIGLMACMLGVCAVISVAMIEVATAAPLAAMGIGSIPSSLGLVPVVAYSPPDAGGSNAGTTTTQPEKSEVETEDKTVELQKDVAKLQETLKSKDAKIDALKAGSEELQKKVDSGEKALLEKVGEHEKELQELEAKHKEELEDAIAGNTQDEGIEPEDLTALIVAEFAQNDAVLLMEAVVAAGNTDRFRRNNELQGLIRGFMASQNAIRDLQARLDARDQRRAERREDLAADGEPDKDAA